MKKSSHCVRVALLQMDVGGDRKENLRRAERLVGQAAERGAEIACLPELFSYMGKFDRPLGVAENMHGRSLSMIRGAARQYRIHIVAGSILERRGKGLPLNSCAYVTPDGEIAAHYSKMHLFDIDIPGKIRFLESRYSKPGKSATVADTPFGRIGFAICNDLRYPEIFRREVKAGARIIFTPSAFTRFTGREHWISLVKVRAVENQCFIIAVNQSGRNADGVKFFGTSVAVDPWGKILCEGPLKGDAVLLCDLNLKSVDQFRKQLPALKKIRKNYRLKVY